MQTKHNILLVATKNHELLSSIWEFVFFQLQNGLYQFESKQNFGGENPFASGSTEKDAADKKNEKMECHILVHKTLNFNFYF